MINSSPMAVLPLTEELLAEIRTRIVDVLAPERVILFGSYAEGTATDESDVDLLVVADTESWHELSVELRRALRPIMSPLSFDLLVYPPESWDFGRKVIGFVTYEADRWGVRLYEAA